MKCKQCGKETNNGTNFCKKKCRKLWIKEHNVRGAKKFYSNPDNDGIHDLCGLNHSCLDKDSRGG